MVDETNLPHSEVDPADLAASLSGLSPAAIESILAALDNGQPTTMRSIAEATSAHLVEGGHREPLELLLPLLARRSEESIPLGELRTRSRSVLGREQIVTWGDLASLSIPDILSYHSSGVTTAKDLVASAVIAHLSTPQMQPNRQATERFGDVVELGLQLGATTIGDALDLVRREHPAEWEAFVVTGLEPTPIEPLVAPSEHPFEDLVGLLSERQRTVVERRLRRDKRDTLDVIGEDHGVTRERIRQIERKSIARLQTSLETPQHEAVREALEAFSESIGPAAPIDHPQTEAALAELSDRLGIAPSDKPSLDLAFHLAGPYRLVGDWLVIQEWDSDNANKIVGALASSTVISRSDASEHCRQLALKEFVLDHMLDLFPDLRRLDHDHWVQWRGNVADKALTVLSLMLEPQEPAAIVEAIGEGHAVNTLRAVLSDDERFVRVDRVNFGLTSWGLDGYDGISNEIVKRIESSPEGWVTIGELIADLGHLAAESSIRVYAGAPRFFRESGRIRLRTIDDPPVELPEWSHSIGGTFADEGRANLTWVVPVDRELLRGSGRVAPTSVGALLGVTPGVAREWTSGDLRVGISWERVSAAQPHLTALRLVSRTLGLDEGDHLVMVLSIKSDEATFFDLADLANNQFGGTEELGADLARCLGCAPDEVVDRLRARGDAEALIDAAAAATN